MVESSRLFASLRFAMVEKVHAYSLRNGGKSTPILAV
jgi:hypothetical protein